VTATKLGHPRRLAYTSDATSATVDPDSEWSHPCERGPAGASFGPFR
jgi:hypothetical protein